MAKIHWPDIRILIAEDEDELRDLLVTVFKSRGSQVYSARDGLEALDIINSNKIDVVLSDVRMPRCDGLKLLNEVRKNSTQNPLFYLVTGYADVNPEEVLENGADRLVQKPFSIENLFSLLESNLFKKN